MSYVDLGFLIEEKNNSAAIIDELIIYGLNE